ncbi:HEAT repeat domain-containing protein [bacterium]|nr:HEAT repeat domain-containing protein [bacterium]
MLISFEDEKKEFIVNEELNQENLISLNLNGRIIAIDNIFLSNDIELSKKLDFFIKILAVEKHPQLIFRLNRMIDELKSSIAKFETNILTSKKKADTNILIGKKEKKKTKKRKKADKKILEPDLVRDEKIQVIQNSPELDVDIIEKYLDQEDDVFVIATMVKALGRLGGTKHKDRIIKYLEHPDSRIRANAVEGLMLTRDASVLENISPLLNSENNRVRANAIQCFDSFGHLNELSAIEKMVEYGNENHLKSAMWVLNRLNPTEHSKELLKKARTKLRSNTDVVDLYVRNQNTYSCKNQNNLSIRHLFNLISVKNVTFMFFTLIFMASVVFPVLIKSGKFNKRLMIIRQVKKISKSHGIDAFSHTLENGGEIFISEQEILKKYPHLQIWEKSGKQSDYKFLSSTIINILSNNGWEYKSMIDNNTFIFIK